VTPVSSLFQLCTIYLRTKLLSYMRASLQRLTKAVNGNWQQQAGCRVVLGIKVPGLQPRQFDFRTVKIFKLELGQLNYSELWKTKRIVHETAEGG
jgi:hypothetical protein